MTAVGPHPSARREVLSMTVPFPCAAGGAWVCTPLCQGKAWCPARSRHPPSASSGPLPPRPAARLPCAPGSQDLESEPGSRGKQGAGRDRSLPRLPRQERRQGAGSPFLQGAGVEEGHPGEQAGSSEPPARADSATPGSGQMRGLKAKEEMKRQRHCLVRGPVWVGGGYPNRHSVKHVY